jgi:hypothetical protein
MVFVPQVMAYNPDPFLRAGLKESQEANLQFVPLLGKNPGAQELPVESFSCQGLRFARFIAIRPQLIRLGG